MLRAFLLPAALALGAGIASAQTSVPATPDTPTAGTPLPATPAKPPPATSPSTGKHPILLPPEKAAPVRIPRFEKPPVIDGKLDDEVWKHAAVFKDFYQIQPGDNISPSKPTEVMIGYDSKFIYFAFHCFDEPGKVRANVAKRDNIFDDDYVGMFLDTFNDQRRAFEVDFNPLGIQADAIYTEGSQNNPEDFTFDLVMESKGVITEDGYTVEVAIPFKSLRYEAGKNKQWGLFLFRRIKRFNNELDSWTPVSRDISGTLNQVGHITGLEGISTERTLELIPSLTISENGKRVPAIPSLLISNNPLLSDPGHFVNRPIWFDPGLTAKLGITPMITLDFALNPDFAQVETDNVVVTANQRFPIFYDEKRPFFLEGKDYFQTPLQAVHTRTIIDPEVAVKLTGKSSRDTFGLLLAADSGPGTFAEEELNDPINFPDARSLNGKKAYIGILRLKRDVDKGSTIGLLATTYNFINLHNQVAGFDGRFRLDPKTFLTFQVLGTSSRRFFFDPEQGANFYRTGNGLGYNINLDYTGRHFGYNFDGTGRTKNYRADLGFTRRVNTNREGLYMRYRSDSKPKARLVTWQVQNTVSTTFDWQGRQQNWSNETDLNLNLHRQTFIQLGASANYERVFEEEFGQKRMPARPGIPAQTGTFAGNDSGRRTYEKDIFAYIESTPSRKYNFFAFAGTKRDAFDFDFGSGPAYPRVSPGALLDPNAAQDPGPGTGYDIDTGITYQPATALRTQFHYTMSRLKRKDTGRLAFQDNIFSLRTTYQFTRFLSARARLDYDTLSADVRPNFTNYFPRLRGQFLLGWTPNPGTAFYIGYNDDVSHNGFSPFTRQFESGIQRNSRTFFIKMSYLIRHSFGK